MLQGEPRKQKKDAPGVQKWNKGPRRKTADTAREEEAILHDLQEIHEASNRKMRSQVCEWAVGNEWMDTGRFGHRLSGRRSCL